MYEYLTDTEKKERLVDLLEQFLGPVRNHYGTRSQIAFDCPECSSNKGVELDGKGNLEINYHKGKFNCWACGQDTGMHGGIGKLIKRWGSEIVFRAYKDLHLSFYYDDEETREVVERPELVLPKEFVPLTTAPKFGSFVPFYNYLTERRITPEIIERFNIGCALDGKYKGRIILPSYNDDDELNYFVTRTIYKSVRKFKYLNCDVPKETIIFNEKFVDWNKPIFIVEGPFDHIVVPNSIPLLGKKMSDLLFRLLYQYADQIILLLDPDAWDRTVQIYNKLDGGRLMGKVLATKLPQDVDVSLFNQLYGPQALREYIRNNTVRLTD
jgi:hypothetical protein